MTMVDVECRSCGKRTEALMRGSGYIDRCPAPCNGERERIYAAMPGRAAVHGDDIPGGVWMKHGICNEDGTPKRYDTKHDINAALDKAGLRQLDEPIPVVDEETDRNLHRKGYENVPRVVLVPGVLSPEDEAKRVAHWHDTERQLQQEKQNA